MIACFQKMAPTQSTAPRDWRGWALLQSIQGLVLAISVSGCASAADWAKEPVPVTVSAANYSKLSEEELYARVNNDPINAHPVAPPVTVPAKPAYYLLLAGEVYPSDVRLDDVSRELETSLEPRGLFNAIYQERAGHIPGKIDYLIRIHYGKRPWLVPIVRRDRVTWGDDGLVANRYKMNLMSVSSYDPRVGLSPEQELQIDQALSSLRNFGIGRSFPAAAFYNSASLWSSFGMDKQLWRDFAADDQESRDYYLVMVEAFRMDDVRLMDRRAPCVWATFIAVPADRGQKFSEVLRPMVQTATPYFGETTHGLQAYEVPPGKVFLGRPVEVPDAVKPPEPQI